MDRFQPVLAISTDRLTALAYAEGDVVRREESFQVDRVLVCHLVSAELSPQRPRRSANLHLVVAVGHDQDFTWLSELVREVTDVPVNQRVVDDVTIHLGERRVALGNPP